MSIGKRILSSVLVLATLIGLFSVFGVCVSAQDEPAVGQTVLTGAYKESVAAALRQSFFSAEDKVRHDPDMACYARLGVNELWCNPYTGEVAVWNTATGQITLTNPYHTGNFSAGNTGIPELLMSQIVINFNELTNLGKEGSTYNSYVWAAERGQIRVRSILNGIRVEYVLGDTTKRYVIPYGVMKADFERVILAPIQRTVVAQMQEFAASTIGVTPEDPAFEEKLDYEAYCRSRNLDRTWGNPDAFREWQNECAKWYEQESTDYQNNLAMGNLSQEYFSLVSVYNLMDPNDVEGTVLENMLNQYEILNEKNEDGTYRNAIYVLRTDLANAKMRKYESTIQKYVDGYTLDDAYADEAKTGVAGVTVTNPVFSLALEYTLSEDGVQVTLPASSIVYDESLYILNYVSVLPYLGSGRIDEGGYVFYPDGSGTIVDFDDFLDQPATISGKVFGADYAYYRVDGEHQESISLPVFGTVEDETVYCFDDPYAPGETVYCSAETYRAGSYAFTYVNQGTMQEPEFACVYPNGKTRTVTWYERRGRRIDLTLDNYAAASMTVSDIQERSFRNGTFSILEEGVAAATLQLSLANSANNPYSSVFARYTPRPRDAYDLADSVDGISASTSFTVLSDNKYLGNYTMRVVMLPDPSVASVIDGYYPASYSGMAGYYRQYLIDQGVLGTISNLRDQLPLYIESFGVIQTTEKILSIPFTVDKALTTFYDVETMYAELEAAGITNIKFRLTGFANGGMTSTYPTKVTWEGKAGGKKGFHHLLSYAADHAEAGMEIFPNFNFMYVANPGAFDGVSLKKDGARSVDNRYAFDKTYSSVYQEFVAMSGVVVSSERLAALFGKFNRKYGKYGIGSLSLDRAASDLSSDFSESRTIDRETAMSNVQAFLKQVRDAGYTSVLSTGGNLYALPYVDYLLEAPIDSSGYRMASYRVPFWGMVMHGHLNYAGDPFNEESDKSEAILRAIESGASLSFILSYDHTRLLKNYEELSKYYSVNYSISKETVKEYYGILNDAIGDLQNWEIVDHRILTVERVATEAEQLAQRLKLQEEFLSQLRTAVARATVRKQEVLYSLDTLQRTLAESVGEGVALPAAFDDLSRTQKQLLYDFVRLFGDDADIAAVAGEGGNAERGARVYAAIVAGTLSAAYNDSVGVVIDPDLVRESACRILCTDHPDAAFLAELDAVTEELSGEGKWTVRIGAIDYESQYRFVTDSGAFDDRYTRTDNTVDNGTVVMVTYSNGTDTVRFVLNFNIFTVSLRLSYGEEPITLTKYGFVRLDKRGDNA